MPYPPILDYRSIQIYIFNPCLVWGCLQLVDLFLISFLAVETSPSNNAKNVAWIKGDVYDHWYHALDILGSSLIGEVAKIIVDGEVAVTAAQKDKGISLKTANKAQEEVFRPAMTKLLRIYRTFVMDSPKFSLASLKEIVICKNNSMRVFLNPSFDTPIFSSRNGRLDELFQPANIEEDELAPSTREKEEMEAEALDANLEVAEEDREILSNLRLQHNAKSSKFRLFMGLNTKKATTISLSKLLPLH